MRSLPWLPAQLSRCRAAIAQSGEVNVYTYRESKLIQPLFDAFTRDTGIKVNVISASSGLEQRIKTEGTNSPADALLTVDIAVSKRRSAPASPSRSSPTLLDKVVAPQYRDPEGYWYGVPCARAWSTPPRSACSRAPSATRSWPT
jgi:iron(III) transport system substrate-binding protein